MIYNKKYLFRTISTLLEITDILKNPNLNQLQKEKLIRESAKTEYTIDKIELYTKGISVGHILNVYLEEFQSYANELEQTDELFKEKFKNIFVEQIATLELIKKGACIDTDDFGRFKSLTQEETKFYNSLLNIIPEWMSNITYA